MLDSARIVIVHYLEYLHPFPHWVLVLPGLGGQKLEGHVPFPELQVHHLLRHHLYSDYPLYLYFLVEVGVLLPQDQLVLAELQHPFQALAVGLAVGGDGGPVGAPGAAEAVAIAAPPRNPSIAAMPIASGRVVGVRDVHGLGDPEHHSLDIVPAAYG